VTNEADENRLADRVVRAIQAQALQSSTSTNANARFIPLRHEKPSVEGPSLPVPLERILPYQQFLAWVE